LARWWPALEKVRMDVVRLDLVVEVRTVSRH
jgi:hypothetical protein